MNNKKATETGAGLYVVYRTVKTAAKRKKKTTKNTMQWIFAWKRMHARLWVFVC